ncbi:hypothetical protein IID27_00920 [Patescibacteria group bacterium]|nr:hypothetical protein [Patescibacteria group bacterium]
MIIDIVKIFVPAALAFFIGIGITPIVTHYLYKHKAWKKKAGKVGLGGGGTPIFNNLHKDREVGIPRMGGIVIWASSFITIILIWAISKIFPGEITQKLDFLSRNQTWIPLFTLMAGSLVGLVDDVYEISSTLRQGTGGLSLRARLLIVGAVALFVALWFFFKLDITTIGMPFIEDLAVGWFFIPFFILVTLALYASGVIDGIDGLSGGVFAVIFAAYSGIAFYQQQIDLAAFSAMIAGGILAFLWFNIPPARFYMSETGTMGLTITLAVVAFMTDSLGGGYGVLVLPIVAFPLAITVLSDIIQVLSKKIRGKKVFLVAPIHHHFEALGWPGYKVTMRFWIISVIFAIIGMILALIG